MHNENVNQVSTLLTLLTGVLKPITGDSMASTTILASDHYERIFIYCLAWSLGGLLDAKDRVLFDIQLRTLTNQAPKKVGAAPGRAARRSSGVELGRSISTRPPLICRAFLLVREGCQHSFQIDRGQREAACARCCRWIQTRCTNTW